MCVTTLIIATLWLNPPQASHKIPHDPTRFFTHRLPQDPTRFFWQDKRPYSTPTRFFYVEKILWVLSAKTILLFNLEEYCPVGINNPTRFCRGFVTHKIPQACNHKIPQDPTRSHRISPKWYCWYPAYNIFYKYILWKKRGKIKKYLRVHVQPCTVL